MRLKVKLGVKLLPGMPKALCSVSSKERKGENALHPGLMEAFSQQMLPAV